MQFYLDKYHPYVLDITYALFSKRLCDLNIEILEVCTNYVSSQSRIEIQGQAPFKQSGVYEAQIAITDSKPSDDSIKNKQFSSLWKGSFHLRVKDGVFSQTIGSAENPLPSSINNLDKIWIVVTDLFSSLHQYLKFYHIF